MKTISLFWGAAACLAFQAPVAAQATPDTWSDNSVGLRYGTRFAEPFLSNPDGSRKHVAKTILNFTHISAYSYGANLLNIDLLQSNSADPGGSVPGNAGAQEAFVFFRSTLDLGKVLGREFRVGPVRGLGITAGLDWNTKNDGYGSKKRLYGIGPTVMFDVPGFLNLNAMYVHETNAPNLLPGRVRYENHWALEALYQIALGRLPLSLEGYALYIGSKGVNEFGVPSAPETHVDVRLMWDVGRSFNTAPNRYKIGLAYEYWRHKFGNRTTAAGLGAGPGATARTPMIRAEFHF